VINNPRSYATTLDSWQNIDNYLQPTNKQTTSMYNNLEYFWQGMYTKLSTAKADPKLFFWPSKILLV